MYGPAPPPSIAERFARVVGTACRAIKAKVGRPGANDLILSAIYWYLQRLIRRFERLAEKAANGTLLPPRKRTPKPPADDAAERPPRPPRPKPVLRTSGHLWIVRHVQYANAATGQLLALLDDAGMQRLMSLDPRFPAMIRPLLRGLGGHPTPAQLPPAPARAKREPKPRPPRPPKKPRAKKVRWWCAKPPRAGLIFSDESLN
jgi:hypothetical protein